jgi:hypothetical protein
MRKSSIVLSAGLLALGLASAAAAASPGKPAHARLAVTFYYLPG